MKNKKKIITIVVAVILVASVFVVGTVANTKNTSITISIDKTELTAGQSATVTVTASADYPVATFSIPVFYDKTMVTVSNATATLTGYDVANVTTDSTTTDASKVYANTGINSAKYGFVLVTYIGGANDTVSTIENQTVLTFTITAKADVSGNALVECITESAKTEENIEGMLYFGATTSGTTITSIPENVENIDVANSISSIKIIHNNPILEKTESATTGIAIDSNKTFGGQYTGVLYGFTQAANNTFKNANYLKNSLQATNGGTIEVVASDGKTTTVGNYGTGTTVTLKDADGNTVATYVVVIFGDVDGNGLINVNDTKTLQGYVNTPASAPANNTPQRMAANCQNVPVAAMMHTLNVNDTKALTTHVNGTPLDQAALASRQSGLTMNYN